MSPPWSRPLGILLVASCALGGCFGDPPPEKVTDATYFAVNRGSQPVVFQATRLWSKESFSVTVPAAQVAELDRVREGTGGHVFPTNFYERYTFERGGVASTRAFSNGDWKACGPAAPDEANREELCVELRDADF